MRSFGAAEIGAPTLPSFVPFDEAMRHQCLVGFPAMSVVPSLEMVVSHGHVTNTSDHAGRSDLW